MNIKRGFSVAVSQSRWHRPRYGVRAHVVDRLKKVLRERCFGSVDHARPVRQGARPRCPHMFLPGHTRSGQKQFP